MPASLSDESALIKEDGQRPVGANTYASLDEANAYHRSRNTAVWPKVDEAEARTQKSAALVRATDWLNSRVRWAGRKQDWQQLMAWPRVGVLLPEGPVPGDQIPPQVVDACCELAGHFMTADSLSPRERGGQVVSETVDCLSVTYAAGAPAETLFPKVSGLLAGLGTADERHAASVEVARG